MKVVFRYSENTSGPIIKPLWPPVFDLIDDPIEERALIGKRLYYCWVIARVSRLLGVLAKSAATHIKPGAPNPTH